MDSVWRPGDEVEIMMEEREQGSLEERFARGSALQALRLEEPKTRYKLIVIGY